VSDRGFLAVAPIGELPPGSAAVALTALRSSFGRRAVVLAGRPLPAAAIDPARGQCCSRSLLAELLAGTPAGARCVVGLTAHDLYLPALTFVFGEAQLGGRAAVVSLCRLREEFYLRPPDAGLLALRLRKEIVHEVGHALGLGHCRERDCVMRASVSIGDTDAKPDELCFACLTRLRPR
jgi:archaemetzincin